MFELTGREPDPAVIARSDEIAEEAKERYRLRTPTAESTGWVERICASARAENRAAAAQLVGIGELFAYRLSQCSETEDWAIDTMAAVAAEVAAGLRISQALAESRVHYARVLRERLPEVGAVFAAGDIDYRAFQTIAYRTDLIEDADILANVDQRVAANVGRWPSMTRGRLSGKIDQIVARVDPDAVRRRTKSQTEREVWIGGDLEGISRIEGSLFTADANALDERLSALAATVCAHDPRTAAQRRADALGALAAGADRLGCRCRREDCVSWTRPPASPVTMHVIAERTTLDGLTDAPGSELNADGLIPPELLRELAESAKLVPLLHPGDAAPEPNYVPSAALAAFVRCRDLTCRWPGCDQPASDCDLDHTIPFAEGGPTHAANLKCYCRTHHLVKTFWGWQDKQLADGTLILTSPAGHTYVTTPGSALLFPSLCQAVGGMPAPEADPPPSDYCADRTAMMPKRRRTRAKKRSDRVAAERQHNRAAREAASATAAAPDHDPPPF